MSDVPSIGPDPNESIPVVVGALGPQMCKLSARRTDGVHPYFTPVTHTAETRTLIGEAFLAPEQMVILSNDRSEARGIAEAMAGRYTRSTNYRRMLNSQGLSDEELDEFSDALFERIFVWGDPEACTARVAEHLDAGADHVCVQVLTADMSRFPIEEWTALTPALRELESGP